MKYLLRITLFFSLLPALAYGQAEHVPVTNFVYDYLDRMQRNGIVTSYSRAALPLERKEVTALIDTIYAKKQSLTAQEQDLARRFYDEFVLEAYGSQETTVLFGGDGSIAEKVFSDKEKYLYAWRSEDRETTIFAELLASAEYRSVFSDALTTNVSLANIGGRFRGTVAGFLGYGLASTNGTSFGDKTFALSDRRLRQNSNYTDYQTDYFDFTEAYISGSWAWGNLSLGKERTLYGNSPLFQTIVSDNAPTFDAIRMNISYGRLRFAFMHGFLLSNREFTEEAKPYYDAKYLAVHRLELAVCDAVRLGVFEQVTYSEREIDPAYLNPVNFYKSAEHAQGDRDNAMLGFDAQIYPFSGVECYGSWTMDDVDFARWGTDWWGNKFIWQGGALLSSILPNTDFGIEYTRIEPYLYTHFFENTTYTHDGYIIGAELPPNSDQWYASVTYWASAKLRLRGTYQYRRHGENVYDEDGNIIQNNGGDAAYTNVSGRDSDLAPFLNSPRKDSGIAGLQVRYEPFRNYITELHYQYLHETREITDETLNQHFLTFVLQIAF